jgi:hypothetical protein
VFRRRNGAVAEREQHVRPSPEGGWDVVVAGEKRPSSHHETDRLALAWAREILRQSGGGRVVLHDRGGQVRDSQTV